MILQAILNALLNLGNKLIIRILELDSFLNQESCFCVVYVSQRWSGITFADLLSVSA